MLKMYIHVEWFPGPSVIVMCCPSIPPDWRTGPGLQGPQPRSHRGERAGEGDGDGLPGQAGAGL